MYRKKTLLVLVGALALGCAANQSSASLVTWQFAGEITIVHDLNNLLDGAITAGTPFSGSYTFESTTPDVHPQSAVYGRYENAITSVSGVIGDLTFGGPIKSDNVITVLLLSFHNYGAATRVDFFGESMVFSLGLRDSTGRMLLDDSLPLSAPSLEGLDPTVMTGFRILNEDDDDLAFYGDLTFLVPEPTTFLLIALGSLAVFGRRQRRSRIAPNGLVVPC